MKHLVLLLTAVAVVLVVFGGCILGEVPLLDAACDAEHACVVADNVCVREHCVDPCGADDSCDADRVCIDDGEVRGCLLISDAAGEGEGEGDPCAGGDPLFADVTGDCFPDVVIGAPSTAESFTVSPHTVPVPRVIVAAANARGDFLAVNERELSGNPLNAADVRGRFGTAIAIDRRRYEDTGERPLFISEPSLTRRLKLLGPSMPALAASTTRRRSLGSLGAMLSRPLLPAASLG